MKHKSNFYIDGHNLNDVDRLDDPEGFLDDIIENVVKCYRAGIVHADLSEYNIIVQKNGMVLLIDWPQAIPTDHVNAPELLERDVGNVLRYFKRKFRVNRDLDETLASVKG